METASTTFEILRPAAIPARPFVVHVPHGSLVIPTAYRGDFVLDDAQLDEELLSMTDRFTDDLAMSALSLGGIVFVNRVSRLVMDPERFENDADEPMSKKGMGAIYLSRQDGTALRRPDFGREREERIEELYRPYHRALSACVVEQLRDAGTCLVIDAHSFPRNPLPYEDATAPRPQVCLGFEPEHDDAELRGRWAGEVESRGWTLAFNQPFAGSLVPTELHRTDSRVKSLMIELRRDLYMNETTGERTAGFAEVESFMRTIFEIASKR